MFVCLFPIAIYFSEPRFASVVCYLSGFSMEKERNSLCVASHGEMTSAWRVNSGQETVFSLPGNKDIIAVKWDSPVSDWQHPVHQESPHKNDFAECFLRRVFKNVHVFSKMHRFYLGDSLEKATLEGQKSDQWLPDLRVRGKDCLQRTGGNFRVVMKTLHILVAVVISWLYIFVRTHNCTPQKGECYSIKIYTLINFTLKMYRFQLLDNLNFLL